MEVLDIVFDAVVDFLPCPHEAVLKVPEDVSLPGPFWSILFHSSAVNVVVEEILHWTGLEDLVPGFGPEDS